MYNISCMKENKESESYMLLPTFSAYKFNNEFILIITKDGIRKPVLIKYFHHSFDRKLRYFKMNWN